MKRQGERGRGIHDAANKIKRAKVQYIHLFGVCTCACVCMCNPQILSLHCYRCVYAFFVCTSVLNSCCISTSDPCVAVIGRSHAGQSGLPLSLGGVACGSASLQAVELQAAVHSAGGEELSVLPEGHARHQPRVL